MTGVKEECKKIRGNQGWRGTLWKVTVPWGDLNLVLKKWGRMREEAKPFGNKRDKIKGTW